MASISFYISIKGKLDFSGVYILKLCAKLILFFPSTDCRWKLYTIKTMDTASSKYRVRTCFKCLEDTKFYCITCYNEMCPQCKLLHVEDIDSMKHDLVLYKDKINDQLKQELCSNHPNKVLSFYCEQCQAPLCKSCYSMFKRLSCEHVAHNVVKLQKMYERRRQQCLPTIHVIRTEALFYRHVILARIKEETSHVTQLQQILNHTCY